MDGINTFDALEEGWRESLTDIKHNPCGMLVTDCSCFFVSDNFDEYKRIVSGVIYKLSYLTSSDLFWYDYRGAFDSHVSVGNCALDALLHQTRNMPL